MGQDSCLNCELIFMPDLFDLTCKCCLQSFQALDDFLKHFLDIKSRQLVCQSNPAFYSRPKADVGEEEDLSRLDFFAADYLDCQVSGEEGGGADAGSDDMGIKEEAMQLDKEGHPGKNSCFCLRVFISHRTNFRHQSGAAILQRR